MKKYLSLWGLFVLFFANTNAQTRILVSESGDDNAIMTDGFVHVKTLSGAYEQVQHPGEIKYTIEIDSDGETVYIGPGDTKQLVWKKSGTEDFPITITSTGSGCRGILSRTIDEKHMLRIQDANYINITNIEFHNITSGALQLVNADHCLIEQNIFKGSNTPTAQQSTGVIWIGGCSSSSLFTCGAPNFQYSKYNKVRNNKIYNTSTFVNGNTSNGNQHHGIYISHFTQYNKIFYNTIIGPPSYGIHFWHGFNSYNEVYYNVIEENKPDPPFEGYGIILGCENKYYNGHHYHNYVAFNKIAKNYVYDNDDNKPVDTQNLHNGAGNIISPNYLFRNSYPYDPHWLSYGANKLDKRLVVGDFDRDGKKNDIAGFYDYGAGQTRIHTWRANRSIQFNAYEPRDYFTYSGGDGWWSSTGYTASKITGRVVSGDFDRDGYIDDIAAFYDYGASGTKIHVWKSTGSSFDYQWSTGWWSASNYTAGKVTDRVVSGDFDRDGYHDDIAAFYDYGNGVTKIHVWKSSGGSLQYQGSSGWWAPTSSYTASNISGRVVSGDFDLDGYHDDIAAFYDYGNDSRIHVWLSTGSSFSYQTSSGWENLTNYHADKITSRVVAADMNKNGKVSDIVAFYDYGNGETRAHVWTSTGGGFTYQNGSNGWYQAGSYTAGRITGRVVAGDFDVSGYQNQVCAFNSYSNCGSLRTHVWTSPGNDLNIVNGSLGYPWVAPWQYLRKKNESIGNLNETELDDDFQLWPNPVKEALNISFMLPEDATIAYEIFDASGKLMEAQSLGQYQKGNHQLQLHVQSMNLKAGLHLIRFQLGDQWISKRIVITP